LSVARIPEKPQLNMGEQGRGTVSILTNQVETYETGVESAIW